MRRREQPQGRASELVQQWQRHILDRVSMAAFILTAAALLVTARSEFSKAAWHATLPLLLTTLGTACFAFVRQLPLRVRSFSLVGILIAAEVYLLALEAYRVPNPFAAAIMTAAIAALLLSSVQAYIALAVILTGFGVVGYRFVSGGAHALGAMGDVTASTSWIRILVVFGVVGATTIWSITFLMQHLRSALTKREELFEALRKESAEHISHLERERLLEQQLRQSQKMEALGKFAGGVAHDFNNLLSVIIACAEQVRLASAEDARKEAIEDITAAAYRGAALTKRLLAFSRQQVSQRTMVNLNQAVADSLRLIERLMPSNIIVEFEPEPGIGAFHGCAAELDQVLMNLCLNARDALPNGGRLWVKTRLLRGPSAEDDRVLIIVADNGLGISAEDQPHLFEPFFTSKAPGDGTGLGLAVVRSIVEQSGGSIDVRSAQGDGSVFTVSFPRGAGTEPDRGGVTHSIH
jgi:signal transduction histidine kinase